MTTSAETYFKEGIVLHEQGKFGKALKYYTQALKINPDFDEVYYNMGRLLTNIKFNKPIPNLTEIIYKILEKEKFIRPSSLVQASSSLLKFDPNIKDVLSKISAGKLSESLQEIIVDLLNVPLLIKLMEVSSLPDLELETAFKNIRSTILLNISKIKNNLKILKFQIVLSLHCFTNEYLYDQTDEEVEALKELENLVEKKLTNGQQPSPTELVCLASYKSLHEYSWFNLLSMPIELEAIQRRQILEPEKEKQLRSTIPLLSSFKDTVSCKVQEQYEQNPYPRWTNLGLPPVPQTISAFTKDKAIYVNTNLDTNFTA